MNKLVLTPSIYIGVECQVASISFHSLEMPLKDHLSSRYENSYTARK